MTKPITSPHNLYKCVRFITMLLLFCFGAFFTKAQPTFCISSADGPVGSTITVDVTVENFTDLFSYQFPIVFFPDVLEFQSIENLALPDGFDFGIHQNVGELRISWFDPFLNGANLPNNTILFSINFKVLSDDFSPIEILENSFLLSFGIPLEISDKDGNVWGDFNDILAKPGGVNGFTIQLKGNIFNDLNLDCQKDIGEPELNDLVVKIEKSNTTRFATTNILGDYSVLLDTGSYTITPLFNNSNWQSCQSSYSIDLTNSMSVASLDIPHQAVITCPQLEVDISTPLLQKCADNEYTINYCNKGTMAASNSSVEVEFDEYLTFVSSEIPFSNQNGNTFTFDIGAIAQGECKNFKVQLSLPCDIDDGVTHCSKAEIFPNNICGTPDPLWSGASLDVKGFCNSTNDSVQFFIQNIGLEDMDDGTQYIVIEDAVMLAVPKDFDPLTTGASQTISYPANGSTMRLEIEQVANHPGHSMPSATVEGCGTNDQGEYSKGFVNQFAQNEKDPFVAYDCHENTTTNNNKQTFPEGYGNQNYIKANTDIEYLIRFQNNGLGSATTVQIIDTLSPMLDPSTLRFSGSSHPVEFQIINGGVVVFNFVNIMIPNSTTNEVASHGFVKFTISQKPDLPNETVIKNTAAIFMDSEVGSLTNTVSHTIGEDFISVNTQKVFLPNLTVHIFPNPFRDVVQFEVEGAHFQLLQLNIYDLTGRLIRTATHSENQFSFYRNQLLSGMYFYTLSGDGEMISSGKITVQ